MRSTEVLVIGAGPAGASAAMAAARGGRSVLVIDKARFPRDKCCGDGLTTEALRQLEDLGIEPTSVEGWNRVTDVVVRAPSGREIRLPLPDDGHFAAVTPRAALDAALVQRVTAEGIEVVQECAVVSVVQGSDRVTVTTSGLGRIEARYVIAADGVWSPTRKLCGDTAGGYRGEWHAFRQYFSDVGPRSEHLTVWFEPDLLPGYAWAFPLPGRRANVGFGIHRGGRWKVQDMNRLWPELLARPHVRAVLGPRAVPEASHRAWAIPARIGRREPAIGRVLFAGDAAAAADPMTGEGIAQALLTGRRAADAVSRAGPFAAETAAHHYRQAISADLGTDHDFARRLSRLLSSSRWTEAALRAADANAWTRRNFARWMFEDYPRAILTTPRRWHRGMLTEPGAWAR